jgi:hypothetical protein
MLWYGYCCYIHRELLGIRELSPIEDATPFVRECGDQIDGTGRRGMLSATIERFWGRLSFLSVPLVLSFQQFA